MQTYSMDLRVQVMAEVDAGLSTKAMADKYRANADWVRKLKRFRRRMGSFVARQQWVSHATKKHITTARISHLKRSLPADKRREVLKDLKLAPAWMHPYFGARPVENNREAVTDGLLIACQIGDRFGKHILAEVFS